MSTNRGIQALVDQVAQLLGQRGLTIGVAEACTAGYLGHLLCSPPGASRYFWGGVIAYSGGSKGRLLGIPDQVQERVGTVSPEMALEMARRVRQMMDTDIGVSTTGVSGPGGGSSGKPIGLFYVGLSVRDGHERADEFHFSEDRMANKEQATWAALEAMRDYLLQRSQ